MTGERGNEKGRDVWHQRFMWVLGDGIVPVCDDYVALAARWGSPSRRHWAQVRREGQADGTGARSELQHILGLVRAVSSRRWEEL